jgi:Phosphorylase superfamily
VNETRWEKLSKALRFDRIPDDHFYSVVKLNLPFDAILVPQGTEYQAVCRGIGHFQSLVIPIPVGTEPLKRYLQEWLPRKSFSKARQPQVLLLGLCGSLSPQYHLGDTVLYRDCVYIRNQTDLSSLKCDSLLTDSIYRSLNRQSYLVRGLTSDRLIWSALEKCHLGQLYNAGVVDMEGFAALEILNEAGIAVAIIRVISDECCQNLPDLTPAFSADGSLKPVPLAIAMLQKPVRAAGLIRGALKGLKVLEQLTRELIMSDGR